MWSLACMTDVQASAIDPTLLVRAAAAHSPDAPTIGGIKRGGDAVDAPAPKVARTSEEEKKARLLARQQRNRQSAQVSREKKKAHLEQLECEVQQLREEKQTWMLREFEAQRKRQELETTVVDLGSKVQNLERLVAQLVQGTQMSKDGVAQEDVSARLAQLVAGSSGETTLKDMTAGAEAASAAPVAAPSSTESEQRTHPLTNGTCLPAAKATSGETRLSRYHSAQQRVPTRSTSWKHAAPIRTRCPTKQQPMAAALQAGPLAEFFQRISKASPPSWQAHTCRPDASSPGHPRRVLRIRLRIPSDRLSMALKTHSLRQVAL